MSLIFKCDRCGRTSTTATPLAFEKVGGFFGTYQALKGMILYEDVCEKCFGDLVQALRTWATKLY